MSDKEKFQRTFDKLHASPDVLTEVLNMTTEKKVVTFKKRRRFSNIAAAAIALVLVLGTGSVAYAMDLGGIQRIVQVWIHGEQTNATLTIENADYTTYHLAYTDEDGDESYRSGGGTAINEDGTSRPLTEEEILEELNQPEVRCEDDGTIWVYYMNQKMEITDRFVNGVCFVQLNAGDETKYLTVKLDDQEWGSFGYALSTHGYVQPDEYNTSEDESK